MLSLILCITSAIVAQNVEQMTRNGKVDLTSVFEANLEDLEYTYSSIAADPQEYFKKRLSEIAGVKDPYPHKFNTTGSLKNFVTKYSKFENLMFSPDGVAIAGRVHHTEKANQNLTFYYLKEDSVFIQVLDNERATALRKGDIIGCIGNPGKTENGTLVIIAREIQLLAPCLHELPNNVEDSKVPRYLNFIVNAKKNQNFYTRAKIIKYIRQFLDNMGFLEVETPILNEIPGGAMAKPFKTYNEDLYKDFFLRISPELFHKMLVVGGFERVYEIGRQFRNEGAEVTHNPEFTSCEFYMAYADYNDLMKITEKLLSGLVKTLFGSLKEVLLFPAKESE